MNDKYSKRFDQLRYVFNILIKINSQKEVMLEKAG